MKRLELGIVPERPGVLPEKMLAWVIRPEREGEPRKAMQVEDMPVPEVGPNEVLVLTMAAGVNFNGVWAARGLPVSTIKMHPSEPFHIAGSDSSGIVWKVGSEVRRWKPGDHVITHCNQSCGHCAECNGLDPMACEQQKIWGYESNWGSFAQFHKVQAQQLLAKPTHLSWEESASYGLTFFTAYRMLIDQADLKAGDNVLIWGAAGGLGIFAIQICRLVGANPIAVIGSSDKEPLVRELGASMIIDRKKFDFSKGTEASRAFGSEIRKLTGGKDPDIVFEHVGKETFPTSVLVAKRFGKIVICGATSGYELNFDVRYLWMRQKQIIGSHFANAYQAERANRLIIEKKIRPVLDQVFPFERTAEAHQLMHENKHKGKLGIRVQAPQATVG
ncbi:MAG: crotonyl-CoA carboxylase/reductase [Deltaproteobacteria bacterium]|nr:crotonyl-CoA carboxylase/reductase [Deltaproteobacteria bacterium]